MTRGGAVSNIERIARALAARHMKLQKDARGEKLPEELWHQKVEDAAWLAQVLLDAGWIPPREKTLRREQ